MQETAWKLTAKHPSATTKPNLDSPNTSHPIVLSKQLLFKTIRESPRGSGAGPSGWWFEHFKVLIENETSADLLYFAYSVIAGGSLPNPMSGLLTSARIIALSKQNRDIRPIAIGECLRRISAQAICLQKSKDFAAISVLFSMGYQWNVAQRCSFIMLCYLWTHTLTGQF